MANRGTPGEDDVDPSPITVQWATDDTAVKTFTVPLLDDAGFEALEFFIPLIASPTISLREQINVARIFDYEDLDPLRDLDNDGILDRADLDRDNDGVFDVVDVFDFDPTESLVSDGDQVGDNIDPDVDGDGIGNDTEVVGIQPERYLDVVRSNRN